VGLSLRRLVHARSLVRVGQADERWGRRRGLVLTPEAVAKHEAAHVVVGVASGLKLKHATINPTDGLAGYAWFHGNPQGPHREALALMYAAGVAWENGRSPVDRALLRSVCSGRHAELALIRAADCILIVRGALIDRVAQALLHTGTLTGSDVAAIARGERLEP
jgi:hypothetical protein